ncbi:MAG TPA: hypothetical protein VNX02_08600 [Steroidobacteraceae bacterium]|nr:hypothetical protein [Steroidobacteraceae bacterium]
MSPSGATSASATAPGASVFSAATSASPASAAPAASGQAPSLTQQEFWQCSSIATTADTAACLDLL